MKWINGAFSLAFLVAGYIGVGKLCHKATDGFSIQAIASNRPFNPNWIVPTLSPKKGAELEEALSQKYTYFGCGGQAYAFFSEDGKYVLKFFKQRLFQRSHILNMLPLPKLLHRFREKRNFKRDDKLARDFFSYWVASRELYSETAVLYSHLNTTDHFGRTIDITGPLGIHYSIDLDKFDFLIQKRAVRIYDAIDDVMTKNQPEKAEQIIASVFNLISTRALKGYRDRDPNIRTNCGILLDCAIKIDVGRFVRCSEMREVEGHNRELLRITAPFREWIAGKYPSLLTSYDKELDEVLLP